MDSLADGYTVTLIAVLYSSCKTSVKTCFVPFDVEAHNRTMIDINYVVQSSLLDSHYNVFGMMSAALTLKPRLRRKQAGLCSEWEAGRCQIITNYY